MTATDAFPRERLRTIVTQLAGHACNDDDAVDNLNDAQRMALFHVLRGRNVFVTGGAGTGKSYFTRCLVRMLQRRGVDVALTATTGLAASNLADKDYDTLTPTTIHSFAGVGLARETADELTSFVLRKTFVVKRLRAVQVWVVDEVSMLDPLLMAKLDRILRAVRQQLQYPFGGVQLVFVGDFYQIPPVQRADDLCDPQRAELLGESYAQSRYAFELPLWRKAIDVDCMLTEVFRQRDDSFVRMLQEVRHGQLTQDTVRKFTDRSEVMLLYDLERIAIEHWGGAERADAIRAAARARWERYENDEEMPVDEADSLDVDWSRVDSYMRTCLRFDDTEALVRTVPLDRLPEAYRMYVSAIEPTQLVAVNRRVHEENERRLALIDDVAHVYRSHVAVKGMNARHRQYESALAAFHKEFETNVMAPSTLTLKRGAQVMLLANIDPFASLVNGRRGVVVDFVPVPTSVTVAQSAGDATVARVVASDDTDALKKTTVVPLVRFDNGVERTVQLHTWKRKRYYGNVKAEGTYYQLPLMLSWAISIHKSQGMSISSLRVDLADVFESGQSYVALSRAVALERLIVSGFDPQMFASRENQPNREVIAYYERIERDAPKAMALIASELATYHDDATSMDDDVFIGVTSGASSSRAVKRPHELVDQGTKAAVGGAASAEYKVART